MKNILSIIAISIIATGLFAQAPQKMSYQAVVRNSTDALVQNTSIGMQISILRGSANGTAVYVERHFPTTNANGLATIEIGIGTIVSGTFAAINWGNDAYFVKTETDLNGGSNYTITGTNQLLSVPYALTANVAENALTSDVADNATLLGGKSSTYYTGRVIQASSSACTSSCPELTEGSTDPLTINSVTITVPGPGKIFVSYNGFISVRGSSTGDSYIYVNAQIVNNPATVPTSINSGGISARGKINIGYVSIPMSLSNTFTVSAAGTYTYYYRARYFVETSLPCTFFSGNMSAIYTQD